MSSLFTRHTARAAQEARRDTGCPDSCRARSRAGTSHCWSRVLPLTLLGPGFCPGRPAGPSSFPTSQLPSSACSSLKVKPCVSHNSPSPVGQGQMETPLASRCPPPRVLLRTAVLGTALPLARMQGSASTVGQPRTKDWRSSSSEDRQLGCSAVVPTPRPQHAMCSSDKSQPDRDGQRSQRQHPACCTSVILNPPVRPVRTSPHPLAPSCVLRVAQAGVRCLAKHVPSLCTSCWPPVFALNVDGARRNPVQ